MKTSETLGEGVGVLEVIVNNVDNDGGGGGCWYGDLLHSFIEIQIFDVDSELEIRIVEVDLVELIGKRSIFGLDTTTNR